jgi:hypothetical protein
LSDNAKNSSHLETETASPQRACGELKMPDLRIPSLVIRQRALPEWFASPSPAAR